MEKLEDRTYQFALRVVKLVRVLSKDWTGQIIGRQLLRAATSVGANVEEAIGATTRREFIQKMAIAYREAREAHYWVRMARDSLMVESVQIAPLIQEVLEIKKILGKTISTARKGLQSAA